jgi:hypothetical protein
VMAQIESILTSFSTGAALHNFGRLASPRYLKPEPCHDH